jgi:hypothetical protein
VKAAYPWLVWWAAMKLTPYAGVYADYYFNSDDNAPLSGAATPILLPTQFVHGWSARVTSGVDMMVLGGTRLSVLGGLEMISPFGPCKYALRCLSDPSENARGKVGLWP